jgi:transglutaminase-like putative cysteine protease
MGDILIHHMSGAFGTFVSQRHQKERPMIVRREFLTSGAVLLGAAVSPRFAQPAELFAPEPTAWQKIELTTRLDLPVSTGGAQAWIPLPSYTGDGWFRPLESTWTTNAKTARQLRDAKSGAAFLHLVFAPGETAPTASIVSHAETRDRVEGVSKPNAKLSQAERKLYTSATTLIPVDGIVKTTSDKITAGALSDESKARAIYEWVVENTFRDAAVRGCGVGDIAAMLESGYLGGKCADINALYVGLARAAGLPARDICGLRVAPSRFGYKSLGANSEIVTKAQHCRAEVFLSGKGWVAVDPADVRKVALEEPPGKLRLDDEKVVSARKALFGSWEGNWLAYNSGHDVVLTGADANSRIDFLMYPQAEVAGVRLDCLDPDNFKYVIKARELSV